METKLFFLQRIRQFLTEKKLLYTVIRTFGPLFFFIWKFKKTLLLFIVIFFSVRHLTYSFRFLSYVYNVFGRGDYELLYFDVQSEIIGFDINEIPPTNPSTKVRLCPMDPPNLIGEYPLGFNDSFPPSWKEIADANPTYFQGVGYSPTGCRARYSVAIIIPLRGREVQLKTLLAHMNPLWQRQQIEYKIYVITQDGNGLFNRAKLLNVGFTEASKDKKYDCYIFHDVDLLSEDDRCLYHCSPDHPRQIAKHIDKNEYRELEYIALCAPWSFGKSKISYFGGVSMVTYEQFLEVNGFSNLYWGWGGEDDDMYMRIWSRGYNTSHPNDVMSKYHMIAHAHEKSNAKNNGRDAMIYHAISRMKYDGLSTVSYRKLRHVTRQLYVNITVDIGQPAQKLKDYVAKEYVTGRMSCAVRMPWN